MGKPPMPFGLARCRRVAIGSGLTLLMLAVEASAQNHKILDATGFQQNRDYFSEAPFENVDTLSGGLVLSFTDLVLPGNAGRELRFQRTYNSKNGRWTFGIGGLALYLSESIVPSVQPETPQTAAPAPHMSDGSVPQMAWYNSPNVNDPSTFNVAISSRFWQYDRTSRTLLIPTGMRCTYEVNPNDPPPLGLLRVDRCWDLFQNVVDFTWQATPSQVTVTQYLNGEPGSENRVVTVAFNPNVPRFPESMTFAGRTWSYSGFTSVTAPENQTWQYEYNVANLVKVTTPHGGEITYTYVNQQFEGPNPQTQYFTNVVKTRATGGTLPPGDWTYDYLITGDGLSGITTVETPTRRIRYTHGGVVGGLDTVVFDGVGGTVPLTEKLVQRRQGNGNNWVTVEREQWTYRLVDVLAWRQFGTLEPEVHTVTRFAGNQSRQYVTAFNYNTSDFGDYHNPQLITETGEAGTRSTVRTYTHLLGPYVLALPTSESVTVGAESFQKSWTYAGPTGFRTSETQYGITTTFAPDAFGNVATAQKANGTTTGYTYQWGLLKDTLTAEHTTTRQINPEGTVASQSQAGRTTAFLYDDLFRLTRVTPPGGSNVVVTEYAPAGGWIRVTRGPSIQTTDLDGFGRPIATQNNAVPPVRTTTQYDAEGRTIREGYPFNAGGSDIGTAIQYDVLDRVIQRTNPDNNEQTIEYGLGTVTFTDEENRDTIHTVQAFGDPSQTRLVSVKDAANNTWQYTYNGLDQLRTATAPDGIARTWEYYAGTNRLFRETHPEAGTVTYTYDAAGVLATKADANGTTFTHGYDDNDRVTSVTAGGQTTTISYEPGSDNRETMTVDSVSSTFAYDGAGRQMTRTDAVNGKTFVTDFLYDGNDRLAAIEYPTPTGASRRFVEFAHDAADRVTRVFEGAKNYASAFQYHPSGAPTAFTSGNGVANTFGYHAQRYWPTSITAGTWSLTYSNYDKVGNVGAIGDTRSGHNQTLNYDALDRLMNATGAYGKVGYAYDLHGNRTGTAFVYDPSTLRLVQQSGVPFTYDNNGNLKTDGTKTLDYTPDNMLKLVTGGATPITYAYDADLSRLQRTENGISTYYLRGLNGELLTEWRSLGTTAQVRDYVYAGSRLVATISRDVQDVLPCTVTPVYTQNFAAGNSLFTSVDVYDQPIDGVDPLYPEVYGAEGVTVDNGWLTWDGTHGAQFGGWSVTGIWIRGFGPLNGGGSGPFANNGFFDARRATVQARYRPTAASLAAAEYDPLLFVPTPNGIGWYLGVAWAPDSGGRLYVTGTIAQSETPYVFAPETDYLVRMDWQVGTVVGSPGSQSVASDGWVRVYINDALVVERLNVPLRIGGFVSSGTWSGSNPPGLADGAWFGYFGLLGPVTDLFIGTCQP